MVPRIVIVGAGPAGEAAAKSLRRLSSLALPASELSITIVEKEEAGGLCLNKGCVPSKTLLEHVHETSRAKRPILWTDIQRAKREVVSGLRSQLESSFKTLKIDFLRGEARFRDRATIEVTQNGETRELPFDKAIIATGTDAFFPPPFDRLRDQLLDSDRMLLVEATPASIIVVGGGAVGCEFACLMNAAGSRVTIVELTPGLLPGEDPAVVAALTRSFEARGIEIKTGAKVSSVDKTADGWTLATADGGRLSAEQLLVCVGRAPSIARLAPENAGINLENGRLVLNDRLQTTNPNVFAAGDAATTRLAHAAAAQAEVAAANVLGASHVFDQRLVPRCLYSWPEVASVGQWKYQLEEKNLPVKASRAFFKGSAKALAAATEAEGFVQIISDPSSRRIVGAQIIGPHATELIHVFSVALAKDMTTDELASVMFAHPTLSEVIREAARK